VETREEIDMFWDLVDREVVFFAPDTGQIQKGGSDAVEVLSTYIEQVRHVHLKDFSGEPLSTDEAGDEIDNSGFLNYVPLGDGVVDIPEIFKRLDAAGFDGWYNIELDGNADSPRPAREAAARSKAYLEQLLGERVDAQGGASHASGTH
jgi:inosose dehydratase